VADEAPVRPTPDLAALAAGLAWGVAQPDASGAALALIGAAFAPWTLTGAPLADSGRGLLVGLVWYGLADRWVGPALAHYGVDHAAAAGAALTLVHAALLVPWWLLASLLVRRGLGAGAALALAGAAWTEPMLALHPIPAAPALMLAGVPALLGATALGGVSAGTASLMAAGAGLHAAIGHLAAIGPPDRAPSHVPQEPRTGATGGPGAPGGPRGGARPGASLLDGPLLSLMLALSAGCAAIAAGRATDGEPLRVGVVQPDTGAFDGRRGSTAEDRAARLAGHARAMPEARFVLTPEAAWPHRVGEGPVHLDALRGARVLLGAWTGRQQVLLDLDDGAEVGRYAKVLPAPASERAVGPWGRDEVQPGVGPALLGPFAALLCYEDASPALLRSALALDPGALVLAANDVWTGGGVGWHRAQATLVAVSSGRWVVRAATSGPSAVLRPDGAAAWSAPARDGDVTSLPGEHAVVDVRIRHGRWTGAGLSPYVAAAAALAALVRISWTRSSASA
jgi:hypothetical protein